MSDEISRESMDLAIAEIGMCQEHLNTSYGRSWQSSALILAGSMATLAILVPVSGDRLTVAILTSVFSVGTIAGLCLWLMFLQRESAFQKVSIRRAALLEESIGMRRSLLIHELDEMIESRSNTCTSPSLTAQEKEAMADICAAVYPGGIPMITPGGTSETLFRIGYLVMAGWIFMTVWRWLIFADALKEVH